MSLGGKHFTFYGYKGYLTVVSDKSAESSKTATYINSGREVFKIQGSLLKLCASQEADSTVYFLSTDGTSKYLYCKRVSHQGKNQKDEVKEYKRQPSKSNYKESTDLQ